jgi:hypothetical protein
MSGRLGNFLDRMRRQYVGAWKLALFVFLGAAVAVNFVIRPHEAEYVLDTLPGFWAVFGLGVAVTMVFLMKKIVQPLLVRPEKRDEL